MSGPNSVSTGPAATAVLTLLALAVPCVSGAATVEAQERTLNAYLGAASKTSGPYLYASEVGTITSGSAEYAPPGLGLESGAASAADRWQREGPTWTSFVLKAPLAQDMHFNLSKAISGRLFVTSTVHSTASAGGVRGDSYQVRIEMLSGTRRIGITEASFSAAAAGVGAWSSWSFTIFPELAMVSASELLTLRVARIVGNSDFIIGTGGSQASYVRFFYFTEDPLRGALYLENGQLKLVPDAEQPTEPDSRAAPSSKGPSGAVFAPALIGLLGLPRSFRKRGALASVAAFVAVGFAGCTESPAPAAGPGEKTPSDVPQATIETNVEERPDLVEAGHGAIKGWIRDEISIGVPGAHVALLGTNIFGTTDPKGYFDFPNVTAGTWTLHADAPKFDVLERGVEVPLGAVVWVNATMVKPTQGKAWQKAHVHDAWLGKTELTVLDGDILPSSSEANTGAVLASQNQYFCVANQGACVAGIKPKPGDVVPPGATRIEVQLTWTKNERAPLEATLATNPIFPYPELYAFGSNIYGARPMEEAFNIAFFPDRADFGHYKVSRWFFFVALQRFPTSSSGDSSLPTSTPLLVAGDKVHIRVTAFRGAVPLEPPHIDYWGNQTELPIVMGVEKTASCLGQTGCDYPGPVYWAAGKALVPAGTQSIRGTFQWVPPNAAAEAVVDWGLAYKTPLTMGGYRKVTPTNPSATSFDFTITLELGDADPFYTANSAWWFYVDDNQAIPSDPTKTVTSSPAGILTFGAKFTLTATAIKDPNWVDA